MVKFSKKSLDFLETAGKQTSPEWLDEHKVEHEAYVVEPLRELNLYLSKTLSKLPEARGYRFPKRGFGRLRRPSHKIGPGDPAYRDWVHLQPSRPSASRFDENPGLYFFVSPKRIFSGGGLYMPSSRQIKKLRLWIDDDPSEMASLFKSRAFNARFPKGFETGKCVKTFPRGYSPDHPRISWLKLQAYYVTREYSKKEFYSGEFKDLLTEDWRQALRFNEVLYQALQQDIWHSQSQYEEPDEPIENVELWDDRL
jgi:uncharacterized protein (TIGR02453 family)